MAAVDANHRMLNDDDDDKVSPRGSNLPTVAAVADTADADPDASSSPTSPTAATTLSTSFVWDAISVIAKLAAMDSSEYHDSVLRRRSPRSHTDHYADIQSLDDALFSGSGQHTNDNHNNNNNTIHTTSSSSSSPLHRLTQHIHRLHSHQLLLQTESDQQAAEIRSLQHTVVTLQKRNRRLERAVVRLQADRQQLQRSLQTALHEKECLTTEQKSHQQAVVSQQQQNKELQELKEAYLLQCHEQYLLYHHYTNHNNRSRTTSADSNNTSCGNSSGLDFLTPRSFPNDHDDDDAPDTQSGPALKLSVPHDDNDNDDTDYSSPTVTTSSVSSGRSYELLDSQPTTSSSSRNSDGGALPYTLTFARGTRVGILIKALPLDTTDCYNTSSINNSSSSNNNSNNKHHQKHHKPNLVLTNALIQQGDDDDDDDTTCLSDHPNKPLSAQQHNPFSLKKFNRIPFYHHNNNNKGIKSCLDESSSTSTTTKFPKEHGNMTTTPIIHHWAHIVTGYSSHDDNDDAATTTTQKPALGARIVAVNQVPVPETMTLQELLDSLHANAAVVDDDTNVHDNSHDDHDDEDDYLSSTYSVTFRNDPLMNPQKLLLQLPLAHTTTPVVGAAQPPDASWNQDTTPCAANDQPTEKKHHHGFHFGFIRLGGGTSEKRTVVVPPRHAVVSDHASTPLGDVPFPEPALGKDLVFTTTTTDRQPMDDEAEEEEEKQGSFHRRFLRLASGGGGEVKNKIVPQLLSEDDATTLAFHQDDEASLSSSSVRHPTTKVLPLEEHGTTIADRKPTEERHGSFNLRALFDAKAAEKKK